MKHNSNQQVWIFRTFLTGDSYTRHFHDNVSANVAGGLSLELRLIALSETATPCTHHIRHAVHLLLLRGNLLHLLQVVHAARLHRVVTL